MQTQAHAQRGCTRSPEERAVAWSELVRGARGVKDVAPTNAKCTRDEDEGRPLGLRLVGSLFSGTCRGDSACS